MPTTVSDTIVRHLDAAGVRHVFGYPGDPSVEFLEAARRANLEFVLGRREGTAGLMAQACGMLTGRPGVALSTLGPGSTNLVNAVASAHLDRAPMLAISGQIDTGRLPTFTHQVVDQEALFAPVSKWATTVAPHTVGHVMRKAHRLACAPRPGPVHLSTPADVVGAEAVDAEVRLPPVTPAVEAACVYAADDASLRRLVDGARRPLVLLGIAAMQAGAGAAIARLAEHLGAAIVTSPMAKGTVAEDHPLFAGTLDMACNETMRRFVDASDLILAVGFDAVELIRPWRVAAPVVHVDVLPNVDQVYAADVELVGPIGALCEHLAATLPAREGDAVARAATHRDALGAAFEAGRVSGALNPSDVVRAAAGVVSPDAIVTSDVGSHKLLIGQGWRPAAPRRLLMTNGLSSMGFSLPAAIAAKLVHPESDVVCFTGDGGLAMVQGELALAASLGLGIKVVVLVDRSLNRIELKQAARGYASTGTVIDTVDVELLARSMGCDGVAVDTDAGLADALATRISGVPLVIGATIDPAQYTEQFR